MGYTVKELRRLIAQHDQHEANYWEKLIETIQGERRFTWAIQVLGLRNGIALMLARYPLFVSYSELEIAFQKAERTDERSVI